MPTFAHVQVQNIQAIAETAALFRDAYLKTGNIHLYKLWMTQVSLLWYMRRQLDK